MENYNNRNLYICKECGTKYWTTQDAAPPSPNWSDGHKCIMEKQTTVNGRSNSDIDTNKKSH